MCIGKADLHCFDLQVLARHRVGRIGRDIEVVENSKRDQRGDALAVRRNLVHGDAAIVERERIDPVARVRREIGWRMRTAVRARMRNHRSGEIAAIERFTARGRDFAECRRHGGAREPFTRQRRTTARHEVIVPAKIVRKNRRRGTPFFRDDR